MSGIAGSFRSAKNFVKSSAAERACSMAEERRIAVHASRLARWHPSPSRPPRVRLASQPAGAGSASGGVGPGSVGSGALRRARRRASLPPVRPASARDRAPPWSPTGPRLYRAAKPAHRRARRPAARACAAAPAARARKSRQPPASTPCCAGGRRRAVTAAQRRPSAATQQRHQTRPDASAGVEAAHQQVEQPVAMRSLLRAPAPARPGRPARRSAAAPRRAPGTGRGPDRAAGRPVAPPRRRSSGASPARR